MQSLIEQFHQAMTTTDVTTGSAICKLVVSALLGGAIGFERKQKGQIAGSRTFALISMGAALAMLVSNAIPQLFTHLPNGGDPARIAAQVISGIGFLGAGTILRQDNGVKGLTTAASLWAVACIGLATGIGYYEGAIISSIIVYVILIFFRPLANKSHIYDDDKKDDNDVE